MEKMTTIYYNLNEIVSKAACFPGPTCYIYIMISLTTFFVSLWISYAYCKTVYIHTYIHTYIHICYSPAGRSVLGETIPEVLSTARGCRPRAVLRPRAQFLPIPTDLLRYKSFRKIFLHSPTYVCWSRTRSCWWSARTIANQNKTLQRDF